MRAPRLGSSQSSCHDQTDPPRWGSSRCARRAPCQPPGISSSRGLPCWGGNSLATWHTIAMISCTLSPRAPPVAPRSKYPAAVRITALPARKLPIVLTLAAHRDREAAQGGEGGPLGHRDAALILGGLPSRPARQGGLRVGVGAGGDWAIGGPRAARPVFTRSGAMSCGC